MKSGVKAIYKKPLTGELKGDVATVLKKVERQFLRRLRIQLSQTGFSNDAKRAFSKAMKIEVKKSSILLTVLHPAWRPMVEGQKSRQMLWLKRAKAPIPIITESGKLIFRSATAKSMADGKWIHPGRKPSNFVELARRETKAWAKKTLPDLLRREIAKTLTGK
jgi:hypothetical protein